MTEAGEQVREQRTEQSGEARSRAPYQKTARALIAVAGMVILMGIITAEALMPATADYSTSASEISHLAGTDPPHSVVVQPSATVFNVTMILSGLMIIAGAYFLYRVFGRLGATIPVALLGVGILGVGIFPASTGGVHDLFALLAFFVDGVAAILASVVETPPLRYISVVLGTIPLLILVLMMLLGESSGLPALLGVGGAERWVAYPIVLWLVVFGGYLMAIPRRREPA